MTTFGLGGSQPKNPAMAKKIREELRSIWQCQKESGNTLLHFFQAPQGGPTKSVSSDGQSSDPLSSFLLTAIVSRRMHVDADSASDALTNLAAALTLAVIWDRLDVAEPIFFRLGQLAAEGAPGTDTVQRKALQRALELQRVNFTQRLLQLPGALRGVEQIDVVKLYSLFISKSEFLGSSGLAEIIATIRPKDMEDTLKSRSSEASRNLGRSFTRRLSNTNILAKVSSSASPSSSPQSQRRMSGSCRDSRRDSRSSRGPGIAQHLVTAAIQSPPRCSPSATP